VGGSSNGRNRIGNVIGVGFSTNAHGRDQGTLAGGFVSTPRGAAPKTARVASRPSGTFNPWAGGWLMGGDRRWQPSVRRACSGRVWASNRRRTLGGTPWGLNFGHGRAPPRYGGRRRFFPWPLATFAMITPAENGRDHQRQRPKRRIAGGIRVRSPRPGAQGTGHNKTRMAGPVMEPRRYRDAVRAGRLAVPPSSGCWLCPTTFLPFRPLSAPLSRRMARAGGRRG